MLELKQIQTQKKIKFTEVQVRIHNTQYNHKVVLKVALTDLFPYIDKIRKETKDFHGRPNYKQFEHLPLVSFVDAEAGEEVVFKTKDDLPKEATEIRTKKGTLIANIH